MQTITFDIPLLIIGLLLLVWLRLLKPDYRFQIACQLVGTFWAQYTFIISWSLLRLSPFFAASVFPLKKLKHGQLFIPFMMYVLFAGLVSALFWRIPAEVQAAYGEGRIWIQLVIFASLVLTARAFAIAMSEPRAPLLMWKALIIIGLIHGLAGVYQYIALYVGLPLIGISRAHGLTLHAGIADIAVFNIGGLDVLRAAGLAGEPRYAAALFGTVLLAAFIIGRPPTITKRWQLLSLISLALSVLGFIGAFSTAGYVGFVVALAALWAASAIKISRLVKYIVCFTALISVLSYELPLAGDLSLVDLLAARSIERGGTFEMYHEPNQVALEILFKNGLVFLFGTGIGSGSLALQDTIGQQVEFSLMPTIGALAFFLEFGLTGVLLLFVPFFVLFVMARKKMRNKNSQNRWEIRFLLTLAITAMIFMLAGSSVGALGYPVAIGSILGAVNFLQHKGNQH